MVTLSKVGIGNRVKILREESGISAKTFIENLGISQQGLSKIETGENYPSIMVLALIASLCGVTTDYILYGKDKIENYIDELFEVKFGKKFGATKNVSAS